MRALRPHGGRRAGPAEGPDRPDRPCGYYGAFDIVIALTALESPLRDLGRRWEPGAAAGPATAVFG